jgi:hypothetical protein
MYHPADSSPPANMSCPTSETLCPLCGNPNRCGVAALEGCWCGKMEIPIELIEMLPEPRMTCICVECVYSFQQNPQEFIRINQTGRS